MSHSNSAPVSKIFPWSDIDIPERYELSHEGVFYKSDASKKSSIHLSGPAWVSANTVDINTGKHGVVIKFIDRRGILKERTFPLRVFTEQSGDSLATILADDGLYIPSRKKNYLKEYLCDFQSENWMDSVAHIGWLNVPGGELSFLFPTDIGLISTNKQASVIYQPEQYCSTIDTICESGSLEDWREKVIAPCSGNPILIFAASIPFAAVMLKHSGLQNVGFHLYGETSTGKTTATQVTASAIGCGGDPQEVPDRSYIQRWNTTENALEAMLLGHNDLPLITDEIQTYSGNNFGRAIHNMMGGTSKKRLDKNANAKPQASWRVLQLSTGEIPVSQKIREDNKEVHGGMGVRLIDIPVHKGIVVESHGLSSEEFVIRLKQNCSRYYGSAIPEFIRTIIREYENSYALKAVLESQIWNTTKRLTPLKAEHLHVRVLKHFALVQEAAKLASKYGILPFDSEEIEDAIKSVVDDWWHENVNMSDRNQGLENVKTFMKKEKIRFIDQVSQRNTYEIPETVPNHAGYIIDHESRILYLFFKHALQEACGNYDVKQVRQEIDKRGFLFKNDRSKMVARFQPGRIRTYFYAVDERLLNDEFIEGH